MTTVSAAGAQPFFLPAHGGQRYCLYHPPRAGAAARGAIVYLHPFAEELNTTRRMAALQARAFAAAGYGVLQIDLHGCGDSSGDFADARWLQWRRDVTLACDWLRARAAGPVSLWGLRLGALLAVEAAADEAADALLLWQPVINGRQHLRQFLRTGHTARMLSDGAPDADDEVAGYRIAPELARAIEALDAGDFRPGCPVHWFERSGEDGELPPASARHLAAWRAASVALHEHRVRGSAFWASADNADCPALLAATAAACAP